ncbi:MAG: hypothetical protein AAEJ53_01500, partial [Myxococcota bacterium]
EAIGAVVCKHQKPRDSLTAGDAGLPVDILEPSLFGSQSALGRFEAANDLTCRKGAFQSGFKCGAEVRVRDAALTALPQGMRARSQTARQGSATRLVLHRFRKLYFFHSDRSALSAASTLLPFALFDDHNTRMPLDLENKLASFQRVFDAQAPRSPSRRPST